MLPLRAIEVRRRVPQLLGKLPTRVAACAQDLLEHAARLAAKTLEYEHEIRVHVRSNALACRAQTRLGIGPITASALVATVGNGRDFKNGRQFAAWLGLVPRQYSTGGKTRLGHITKRGDPYLRTLLVMGARAVLQRAASLTDPLSRWALAVRERRGYHRACIAIAAKNARVAWALLAKEAAIALTTARKAAVIEQENHQALHPKSKQVRPALAEPDRLPSGNRCLTIEARARGLHAGPSAKHSPVAD